eukprot:m.912524 g.912524  ORF g.912524 m.912524 type:complete len:149 (+) comp23727_c0_seq18:4485-4931(+)
MPNDTHGCAVCCVPCMHGGRRRQALGQLLAELDAREQHDLQTLHTQYALMEARLRAAIATHERAAAKPDTPQGVLHGPITRTEAEARLTAAGGHAGMFLVRSKADGAHVFSICHMTKRNAFHHILAEPTEEVVDGLCCFLTHAAWLLC